MLRKAVILLLLLPCATLTSRADDASKTAKVHELFKLMKLDRLTAQLQQQVMDQTGPLIQQMFGVKFTPDQEKKMGQLTDKLMSVIQKNLGWDGLEPEYAKLYADAYTEDQIDDLIAFYRSPTGQLSIEKTPLLMREANSVVQQHMATAMPEVQAVIQDFMKQSIKDSSQAQPQR